MSTDYHHGDLPAALRAAAVELIAEKGPNSFSLREVARRAGVSHAAPAHHFGDTQGLLTSVAAEGYAYLASEMAAATNDVQNVRDRFIACGRCYVTTALANPGHYGVMVGHDYTDANDENLVTASVGAYEQLLEMIRAVADEYNPNLDIDKTATLVWATVHGLVELAPVLGHVAEKTGTASNQLEELIERFADQVISSALR